MVKYKFVIIEETRDNEVYITHIKSKDDVSSYESHGQGNYIVISESAYKRLGKI